MCTDERRGGIARDADETTRARALAVPKEGSVPGNESIALSSKDGSLVLRSDENDWCVVLLDAPAHAVPARPLGADTQSIITARLLRALHEPAAGPPSGVIDGVPVHWVLSLFERHSRFYVGEEGERRTLFILADDGSLLTKLPLEAEDVARWKEQLRAAGA